MFGGVNEFTHRDEIYKEYNQEEIFKLAGLDVVYNRYVCNPFRKDNTPGCFFKWVKTTKGYPLLLFYDYTGYFGKACIDSISLLQRVTKYNELKMLSFIKKKVSKAENKIVLSSFSGVEGNRKSIQIRIKKSNNKTGYFDKFGIPVSFLEKENTFYVEKYWCSTRHDGILRMNRFNNPIKEATIAYCFPSTKNIKLYFPEDDFLNFYTNCSDEMWGLEDIKKAQRGIITKSGKDYLLLKYLGYNVVALQSESHYLTEFQLQKIKANWKEVVVLFDNDEIGKLKSKHFSEMYGFYNFIWPLKEKDPSDSYLNDSPLTMETLKLILKINF